MSYDALYAQFFYYFNIERDYFECHEVMEALWLEERRDPYYQGLLQVAVGLYHHRNGNLNGAVKLMSAAAQKLKEYPDICQGIRLSTLRLHVDEYLTKLLDYENTPFTFYDLNIEILDPQLQNMIDEYVAHPPVHDDQEEE